jgi:hypothetical protein
MWTFRFLPTILLRRRLIIVKPTTTKRRGFLDSRIHNPRFLRDLIRRPKRHLSKARDTLRAIMGAMIDIGAVAIAFSIGPGNTVIDFAHR